MNYKKTIKWSIFLLVILIITFPLLITIHAIIDKHTNPLVIYLEGKLKSSG